MIVTRGLELSTLHDDSPEERARKQVASSKLTTFNKYFERLFTLVQLKDIVKKAPTDADRPQVQ